MFYCTLYPLCREPPIFRKLLKKLEDKSSFYKQNTKLTGAGLPNAFSCNSKRTDNSLYISIEHCPANYLPFERIFPSMMSLEYMILQDDRNSNLGNQDSCGHQNNVINGQQPDIHVENRQTQQSPFWDPAPIPKRDYVSSRR